MRVIQTTTALLAVIAVTACGPEPAVESTWMVGTFSSVFVGARPQYCAVPQIKILEDGTLLDGGLDCDHNWVLLRELQWRRLASDRVEVLFPMPEGGIEGWHITPGDDCRTIQYQKLRDGELIGKASDLVRGAVCVRNAPSCDPGIQCDPYIAVWCDGEPPPPCEEEGTT